MTEAEMRRLAIDIRAQIVAAKADRQREHWGAAEHIENMAVILCQGKNQHSVRVLHLASSIKSWKFDTTDFDSLVRTVDRQENRAIIAGIAEAENEDT